MLVDLHLHTTASDGALEPAALVDKTKEAGISIIAVTDHETTRGVDEARTQACNVGVGFLSGVEITTSYEQTMYHVLGYGVQPDHEDISLITDESRRCLMAINDQHIRTLEMKGYGVNYKEYETYFHDKSRGGWKSLSYLVDKGIVNGPAEYFALFPYYDPYMLDQFPSPYDVAKAISRAGGCAILAHPGDNLDDENIISMLNTFMEMGIAGVECFHRHNSEAITKSCLGWCRKTNALITGGSDYHGGWAGRGLGEPKVELSQLNLGELIDKIQW